MKLVTDGHSLDYMAGRPSLEERAKEWVLAQGGQFVGEPYMCKKQQRVKVECKFGHSWDSQVQHLAHQHWCPDCYGNRPLTLKDMQNLAEARGGKCLSNVYINSKTHLEWSCFFGHTWPATPNNAKNFGSWCPKCKINVGEELVRAALEEAFPGYDFDRTRREDWLRGLELDGYNEILRLAFEYQGVQHSQRVEHFQRTEEDFEAQLERDALTLERCDNEWVTLLAIPHTIKYVDLRAFVRREVASLGYEVAPTTKTDAEFYNSVRAAGPTNARQFARAQEIIATKGGTCLSTQYVGYRIPLQIRCGKGHVFDASLEAIAQAAHRGPRFCTECGGTRRQEAADIRAKVEACGYRYIDTYFGRTNDGASRRYISVVCPNGHAIPAKLWDNFKPTNDQPKRGCASCHYARNGASKRGDITMWCGQYQIRIDRPYEGQAARHIWTCSENHSFEATMSSLKQRVGNPCIHCFCMEFAEAHKLDLITGWDSTFTQHTKLQWRCRKHPKELIEFSRIGISRKKVFCKLCG